VASAATPACLFAGKGGDNLRWYDWDAGFCARPVGAVNAGCENRTGDNMTDSAAGARGGAAGERVAGLLIDRQLPRFEARSFSPLIVDVGPEGTYQAVRALDPEQVAASVPLMRLMGRARALPARIAARRRNDLTAATVEIPAQQAAQAFLVLDEQPGVEFVVGMIGKFMSASQLEFRRFEPAEFAGFGEPGYGKVAVNFRVVPYGATRSLLCTETRTATTDPESARRFRRYWAVIGPFAGYIMRHWLTLAKHHAERQV
jgi:hypothetical protein